MRKILFSIIIKIFDKCGYTITIIKKTRGSGGSQTTKLEIYSGGYIGIGT